MSTETSEEVRSADGTTIAFQRSGVGPPLILVDPAGGYSGFDNVRALGRLLAAGFTVYSYDRRGRGGSGDTLPYAIAREVEDLAALVAHAGGSASVYGFSSGALLACQAAASGVPVEKLALLEPPFATADGLQVDPGLGDEIATLVAAGRRDEAVEHWLTSIGVPPDVIAGMEPVKPALAAVAHTLAYDWAITSGTTPEVVSNVAVPTVVLHSEASDQSLSDAAAALADALPHGTRRTLAGEWHGVDDDVLAPVLRDFLRG